MIKLRAVHKGHGLVPVTYMGRSCVCIQLHGREWDEPAWRANNYLVKPVQLSGDSDDSLLCSLHTCSSKGTEFCPDTAVVAGYLLNGGYVLARSDGDVSNTCACSSDHDTILESLIHAYSLSNSVSPKDVHTFRDGGFSYVSSLATPHAWVAHWDSTVGTGGVA